jgi:hypothetical protein
LWLPFAVLGCLMGVLLVTMVFIMVFGGIVFTIDHIYEKFKKRK